MKIILTIDFFDWRVEGCNEGAGEKLQQFNKNPILSIFVKHSDNGKKIKIFLTDCPENGKNVFDFSRLSEKLFSVFPDFPKNGELIF